MSATLKILTVGPPNAAYGQVAAALDQRGLSFVVDLEVECVEPQLYVHHDHGLEVGIYLDSKDILAGIDDIERAVRSNPI